VRCERHGERGRERYANPWLGRPLDGCGLAPDRSRPDARLAVPHNSAPVSAGAVHGKAISCSTRLRLDRGLWSAAAREATDLISHRPDHAAGVAPMRSSQRSGSRSPGRCNRGSGDTVRCSIRRLTVRRTASASVGDDESVRSSPVRLTTDARVVNWSGGVKSSRAQHARDSLSARPARCLTASRGRTHTPFELHVIVREISKSRIDWRPFVETSSSSGDDGGRGREVHSARGCRDWRVSTRSKNLAWALLVQELAVPRGNDEITLQDHRWCVRPQNSSKPASSTC
jgi:hypothetical protein